MVGENHAGGQVYTSSWPTAPGGARAAQYSHSPAPQRPSWQDTLHPCRYNRLPRLHPVPAQAHLNEAGTASTSPKAPCLNPTDPATVGPAPSLQPAPSHPSTGLRQPRPPHSPGFPSLQTPTLACHVPQVPGPGPMEMPTEPHFSSAPRPHLHAS